MRAALFDLDETILDRAGSLRDFALWQAKGMLRFNINDVDRFVERFIELDQKGMVWKDEVYKALIDEFEIVDWSVDDLLNTYVLMFSAFRKPRRGAAEAVEACRRKGFKIVLVTNGKSPFQERNFQKLDCSRLFDSVIVSEVVGLRKPEKAIFELACRVVDADVESSVFIGDNPVADMEGAKLAGMKTIYIPIDLDSAPCEYADATFLDMFEVSGYIEKVA